LLTSDHHSLDQTPLKVVPAIIQTYNLIPQLRGLRVFCRWPSITE